MRHNRPILDRPIGGTVCLVSYAWDRMEFRAERNEAADDALRTGFTVGATEDQVRYAMNTARERLASAENLRSTWWSCWRFATLSTRGLSVREIAAVVGISKSAVSRQLPERHRWCCGAPGG